MSDIFNEQKEFEAVIRADKREAASPVTPYTNRGCITHFDNSLQSQLNVCIDWLSCTFNGSFDPYEDKCAEVLKALALEDHIYDEENFGLNGYKHRYVYDEKTVICFGGDRTKNADGEDTWQLILSGEACRDYETRTNGDWLRLFHTLSKHKKTANRIDVTIDDFSGIITVEDLIYRIRKKLYTTRLRKVVMQGQDDILLDKEGTPDPNKIIESNKEGYTVYFGTSQTKQLCIYNKRAERAAKEYIVFAESWMRYELRFGASTADVNFGLIYAALLENTLPEVVAGLIGGVIEFKEENNFDSNHQYLAPTWHRWTKLLQNVSKIKAESQARRELTLAKKYKWFKTASGRSLMMFFLALPEEFYTYLHYIILRAKDKMKNKDVAIINKLRQKYEKDPITLDTAIENIEGTFGKELQLSPSLIQLLDAYEAETGEIISNIMDSDDDLPF